MTVGAGNTMRASVAADPQSAGTGTGTGTVEVASDDRASRSPGETYVCVFFHTNGLITSDSVRVLRRALEDQIGVPNRSVDIDLWIHSSGGMLSSGYKMGILLRAYAARLRVVVPDYAKSTATLLALAADEIYMAPAAELGPIDPQITRRAATIERVSAMEYSRAVDEFAGRAIEVALRKGAAVDPQWGLDRAETMSLMLKFVADMVHNFVGQVDPMSTPWAGSMAALSLGYATELLERHADVLPRSPAAIAGDLVDGWPAHEYVITRVAARALGLPIRDVEDYPAREQAMAAHRSWEDDPSRSVLQLMPLAGTPGLS